MVKMDLNRYACGEHKQGDATVRQYAASNADKNSVQWINPAVYPSTACRLIPHGRTPNTHAFKSVAGFGKCRASTRGALRWRLMPCCATAMAGPDSGPSGTYQSVTARNIIRAILVCPAHMAVVLTAVAGSK